MRLVFNPLARRLKMLAHAHANEKDKKNQCSLMQNYVRATRGRKQKRVGARKVGRIVQRIKSRYARIRYVHSLSRARVQFGGVVVVDMQICARVAHIRKVAHAKKTEMQIRGRTDPNANPAGGL